MPLTNDQIYSLVGRFLHDWALMEAALNQAIKTILQLDPLQGTIVCVNIPFFNKTHILKTAVDHARLSEEKSKKYKAAIEDIKTFSYERNMVAHDLFVPSDDGGGVKFLVAKAKGSLKFPETTWTPEDFDTRSTRLFEYVKILDEIGKETRTATTNLHSLAAALMAYDSTTPVGPNPHNPVLGSLGPQMPPPPDNRSLATLLSTPQKEDETHPSSEE